MPDTLPQEWTWECVPEWERSVLQAVSTELSRLFKVRWTLFLPSFESWQWFGLKIWKPSWFGILKVGVGTIFCCGNILTVNVYDKLERFDLYEPDSINKIVEMIRRTMGC